MEVDRLTTIRGAPAAVILVRHHEGAGLANLPSSHKDKIAQFDLEQLFFIAEEGREHLKIRSDAEQRDQGPDGQHGQRWARPLPLG